MAKNKTGLSYYEIAKELDVSKELVSRWKLDKSNPNGLHTLKLAELAGVEIKEAIKLVEGGYVSVSLLFVTSSVCMLGLALLSLFNKCILCKIKQVKLSNSHHAKFA